MLVFFFNIKFHGIVFFLISGYVFSDQLTSFIQVSIHVLFAPHRGMMSMRLLQNTNKPVTDKALAYYHATEVRSSLTTSIAPPHAFLRNLIGA